MTCSLKTTRKMTSYALSVSPFFNPKRRLAHNLTQKNGVKAGQIQRKTDKLNQRSRYRKTPEIGVFPGFLNVLDCVFGADQRLLN